MINLNKIFITLLLTLALACQFPAIAQQMRAANVNVAAAEFKSLSPYAWVSGTVVSRNNSNLASEVSGRLIELANLGSRVNKGDVIAKIDDRNLQNRKQELKAGLVSAKANYDYLSAEVERIQALTMKNLLSKTDLDRSISNRDIAFGALSEVRARLKQVEQDIEYTSLIAPFDGLITKRLSNIGEYITAGTAIIHLVETAELEASVFAPLSTYQYLQKIETLAIQSEMGDGFARIKSLIPVADNRSHLMEIRLDMTDFNWPIGLSLKAAVINGEQQDVLAVPRDALVLRKNGISIFKVTVENTAQEVNVTVGIGAGDMVQIKGDVKAGEQLVIRGAERLNDGQPLRINASNDKLISGIKK